MDVLLLQDVLGLQGQSAVIVSRIAGVKIVLLREVVLICIADEWLVQLCLLTNIGY